MTSAVFFASKFVFEGPDEDRCIVRSKFAFIELAVSLTLYK